MSLQKKWDGIYTQREGEVTAASVLLDNQHLLPSKGRALDLACGLGGNAKLLAKAGLEVDAWDISPVAIKQLQQELQSKKLTINAQVHDVIAKPPEKDSLDVIVVSFFLDRDFCEKLILALKPGGLLFYQTYCQEKVDQTGPKNPDYLLADNELLQLFPSLKVRVYREEALLGDHQQGFRNMAFLVAEK
jgi:tellurite methyltransferase